MANLLYQIWEDPELSSIEVCRANRLSDEQRGRISPRARLVHSYRAGSFREAMEIYYRLYDYGHYHPAEGTPDELHSDEELAVQRAEGYDV